MLVGAYTTIVALTWILVGMNVRSCVIQFAKDRNTVRLYSYLITLLIMGSLIIGVSSAIIQRVIDSENLIEMDQVAGLRSFRH
jgi:hypothetical protein